MLPILEQLDRTAFETVCYSTRLTDDAVLVRLRKAAWQWRDARALDDLALVDRLDALFRAGCEMPTRHHHTLHEPNGPGSTDATLLLMPAWTQGAGSRLGIKMVTVYPDNGSRGLPAIFGQYVLLDGHTGRPLALLDGTMLTKRRTACASGLASRYLSRSDATHLTMIGTGANPNVAAVVVIGIEDQWTKRVVDGIAKTGKPVAAIQKLAVWGNHSPTKYADYRFATIAGQSVKAMINDQEWNANVFLPTVGKRGAAIIEARGLSSAASAANAAIDHMRDWALGTHGKWVTMGIPSQGWYGIPKDVMFGFPVTCENGQYKVVEGLEIDAFSQSCIDKTLKELTDEQAGVAHLV